LIIISALAILTTQAWADAEIVIAIRYLQAEGTSHSHLYLYREDGKLLRQLTNDNSGQDSGPIFAPDGSMIVFTREKPNDVREFWSVEPLGKTLKKLDAAPDWYVGAKKLTLFHKHRTGRNRHRRRQLHRLLRHWCRPTNHPMTLSNWYYAKIRRTKMIRATARVMGKHYLLRDLKTGAETEFDKLPGFYGVFGLLHEKQDKDQHFLFDGPFAPRIFRFAFKQH